MEHMQETEFAKLTKNISDDVKQNCSHPEIVRLYDLEMHSDYGCLQCGCMGRLEDLKKN